MKITNSAYFGSPTDSPLSLCSSILFWLPAFSASLPSNSWFPVPGAPPRKLEVEAVNSTAIRVTWKPPLQGKQHGQIRGYQVIFSRLENGEPRGQPNIMDVALPEAQVLDDVLLFSSRSLPFTVCSSLMFISLYCHSTPHLYFLQFSSFTLHFPHTKWHMEFSFYRLQSSPTHPFFFSVYSMQHFTLNWYPAPTTLDFECKDPF